MHRGQGRIDVIGEGRIVVPNDGDVARAPQTALCDGVEDSHREEIVMSEDRRRSELLGLVKKGKGQPVALRDRGLGSDAIHGDIARARAR
jgi:hypothetical protein